MNLAEKATNLSKSELVALLLEREEASRVQIASRDGKISELEARLKWFEKQLFGRKSERRLLVENSKQLPLGLSPEECEVPTATETVKEYQRRVTPVSAEEAEEEESRLRFSDAVPVEEIHVANPELDNRADLVNISEKVTYRLAQRPGSYVVLKYIRKVVKTSEGGIESSPAPAAVIDRSFADVSFIAGLLVDKLVYHLPLYRQHQRLAASGITISRQTLTNLAIRASSLLEPIYFAHFSSALQSKVLAMDETPVKAGKGAEKGKLHQGYFWAIYGDKDEVVFPYSRTRAHSTVKEILGEFAGTLLSDGYAAYSRYAGESSKVVHAQCWAHARRKFVESKDAEPNRAEKALEYIGRLYHIEEQLRQKHLAAEEVLHYRVEHSRPIVEEFFLWLSESINDLSMVSSNPFIKAASYACERRTELSVFLSDPAVPLDTNHLERALRVVPMGRKNWLFCWTELGAEVVGRIQSLLVTCRLHGIDPFTYLVDVLQRIDRHHARDIEQLIPRLWKAHFAKNPLTSDVQRQSRC